MYTKLSHQANQNARDQAYQLTSPNAKELRGKLRTGSNESFQQRIRLASREPGSGQTSFPSLSGQPHHAGYPLRAASQRRDLRGRTAGDPLEPRHQPDHALDHHPRDQPRGLAVNQRTPPGRAGILSPMPRPAVRMSPVRVSGPVRSSSGLHP